MSLPNDIVPDRDEAMRRQREDPLLGSAASAGEAAGLACPDAEALGLYAERALSRAEAASIEAHVRSCARCDEVLAAIALALPGAVAVDGVRAPDGVSGGVGSWLRGWRWMVPAMSLAGAAAVAFWLGRSPAPVAETDVARIETGLAREVAGTDAARDNVVAPSAPPAAARMSASPAAKVGAAPAPVGALTDGATPGPGATAANAAQPEAAKRLAESADTRADAAPAERRMATRERPAESTVAGSLAADAAKPAPPAAATVQAEAAQAMAAQAPARAAEAAPAPAAPTASIAAAPQATGAAAASREERARALGATASGAAGGGAPSGAGAADLRAPFERWRVRNGRLEFARDGRAWRRVTLPTSERIVRVTERPDASVLVVTASGAELVSMNLGATWQRP